MTILVFTLLVFSSSAAAGLLGAVTGLGGGVVLVPLLTLGFGVQIHYAMGASLVAVIATSSGAAAAFLREGLANLRVGMFLETGATAGALLGAWVASALPKGPLALVFGVVLLYSAWGSTRHVRSNMADHSEGFARRHGMEAEYLTPNGLRHYHVYHAWGGLGVMGVAGMLSGMLGIGSGAVKVLAMDQIMKLPYKVATSTSNFMIGITAAASAGVYMARGYVDPGLTMPVMLGVLAGSLVGARMLVAARSRTLRNVFAWVVVVLGLQMVYKGYLWGLGG